MSASALRRGLAALGATAIAAALVAAGLSLMDSAPAAAAGDVGYVRLAHLSPDTPDVDVYLSSATNSVPPKTFPGVGYGVVSPYLSLPAGTYAVAMRTASAPASSPPVLTTQVTVEPGKAYTVAGVGRHADLGLRVIDDDLSLPPGGHAKVRIVQELRTDAQRTGGMPQGGVDTGAGGARTADRVPELMALSLLGGFGLAIAAARIRRLAAR